MATAQRNATTATTATLAAPPVCDVQLKVFTTGYAICGPGFQSTSEFLDRLQRQDDCSNEEMLRKNQFDCNFFQISKEQASTTDPQIRLLLELTYEALADSGVTKIQSLPLRNTGVYVGSSFSDFQHAVLNDENHVKGGDHVGTAGSMLANKISQFFQFGGPSMKIDSACSSSLQALDIACTDLRSGKVSMAIVAGCNLIIDPVVTTVFQQMRMVGTASQPACKSFSDSADGYVRQEAVSVLVLSTEETVNAHSLSTVAEIIGHCTLSGSGDSISTPCVKTQELLYRKVASMARSLGHNSPVRYVECHGSGTKIGDEAEISALAKTVQASDSEELAMYNRDESKAPLFIGSVKSNIGHTEAASGLTGVIKVLLSLESGKIPPNLHYSSAACNPNCVGLRDGTLMVVDKPEPINSDSIAVVNSFGFGGTYVQVMLRGISNSNAKLLGDDSADKNEPWKNINAIVSRSKERCESISSALQAGNMSISGPIGPPVPSSHECDARAFTSPLKKIIRVDNVTDTPPPLWVVFTGIGANWPGMGFELYEQSLIYKRSYDRCNAYLNNTWKCNSLQTLLGRQQPCTIPSSEAKDNIKSGSSFHDTIDAAVCLTTLQICLVDVLRAGHVTHESCAGFIGYSAGEIAAGYFDGSLSWQQALDVAFLRGQAVVEQRAGAMLNVSGLSRAEMECLLSKCSSKLKIACHTGPVQVTLSGLQSEVEEFELELRSNNPACKFSRVETCGAAFHSHLISDAVIDVLKAKLVTVFKNVKLKKRSAKWASTCSDEEGLHADSTYFCNGFQKCVEFNRECRKIPEGAIIVECGPSDLFRSIFRASGKATQYLSLLSRNENAIETLGTTYGKLFLWRVVLSGSRDRVSPRACFPKVAQRALRDSFIAWDKATFSMYVEPRQFKSVIDHNDRIIHTHTPRKPIVFDLCGTDSWLMKHKVDGRILLPAAVPIFIIWTHLPQEKKQHLLLKKLTIHYPLDISALQTLTFDVVVTDAAIEASSDESHKFQEVQVICRADHVSITKQIIASCSVRIEETSKSLLKQSVQKCNSVNSPASAQTLYHRLGRHDYDYGDDFQVISALSINESKALLRNSSAGDYCNGDFTRKAVILFLEGMLQFSVVQKLNNSQFGSCYLPVLIDTVLLCHPSAVTPFLTAGVTVCQMPGKSLVVNNFAVMTGVHLQKKATPLSLMNASVGKVKLVPVTPGGAVNSSQLKNDIKIFFLKCDGKQSHLYSKLQDLSHLQLHLVTGIALLVSGAPGFSGFVRSLQKEPMYKHVRGLQLLYQADTQSAQFNSILTKANLFFSNGSHVSCLFIDRGKDEVLQLLEEKVLPLSEMTFPSPRGCFLAFYQLRGSFYCWKAIERSWHESPSDLKSHVHVKVEYASLNFRDAMIGLGKLPRSQAMTSGGYSSTGGGYGLDFAGYYVAPDRSSPIRVIGLGRNCIASDIYAQPKHLLWELQDNFNLEAFASVPCVYATAYYALCLRGRLHENDNVLVHCGAGGVGLAALYICKNRLRDPASQLFVTCGSAEKRSHMHDHFGIPRENIGNSRNANFQDMVMKRTGGAGVNMVLNSLVGPLMEASAACLSFGGMLLELGKAHMNTYNDVILQLRRLDRQLVLIDLDQIMSRPQEFAPLHALVAEGMRSGEVQPLPCEVFSALEEMDSAFEKMTSNDRIGKVLVKMETKSVKLETPNFEAALSERSQNVLKSNIVIVGGLGGLGLCLAQHLASQLGRVCNFVLCTRSGEMNQERQQAVEYLRNTLNSAVDIRVGDFSKRDVVDNMLQSFTSENGKIIGFFNLAAKTHDMHYDQMDVKTWTCPFAAKCDVSENFSNAFCDPRFANIVSNLHHFVCFSSIVSGEGNAGQTNYACANAAMEDIIARRVERELPGLCIRLGIVRHTGLACSLGGNINYAHLCPVSANDVMDQVTKLVVSEQTGICTLYGAASGTRPLAKESEATTTNSASIFHCATAAKSFILDIFRRHVHDGIVHEHISIIKHSFDSLGMYILYDELQKSLGGLQLSIGDLFALTPMEVVEGFVSRHAAQSPQCPIAVKRIDCERPIVAIMIVGEDMTGAGSEALVAALNSIKNQTRPPDDIVVVFEQQKADNELGSLLATMSSLIPPARIVFNQRTKATKAGAANTGIMEALSVLSEDNNNFWVAFLDPSHHTWQSSHLEQCLQTASRAEAECGWIVSWNTSGESLPKSSDICFFAQNSPKSSWLVRYDLLLEAGTFDEALADSMDNDLSIRLCDVMTNGYDSAVTTVCTVTSSQATPRLDSCYADADLFLYKHHSRMTLKQLNCTLSALSCDDTPLWGDIEGLGAAGQEQKSAPLEMWSDDKDHTISVRFDVSEALTGTNESNPTSPQHRKMLVGITTSDTRRISGLLSDLGCLLDNKHHCVVVFANSNKSGFADEVSMLLQPYCFRSHVIRDSDRIVQDLFTSDIPLPIAKSRTVLQTFLHATANFENFEAIAVLDDDSRLPKGWGVRDGDEDAGDIFLGRAIKTPPNPTAMSMRTQLLDLLHELDARHAKKVHSCEKECAEHFYQHHIRPLICPSLKVFQNMDDQYYDLSSARWDHLELPRILTSHSIYEVADDKFVEDCRRRIMVGDPLAREAVSHENGLSCQRGGCMVLLQKQFHLLQYEQVAPTVVLASGRQASSRRSDTFWVMNHHKSRAVKPVVRRHLSFLHENKYDSIPTQEKIRESVALEMIGAILCRPRKERTFASKRMFALKCSIFRIRGICKAIRGRSYFAEGSALASFVDYLEQLFDLEAWDREVFQIVEKHMTTYKSWQVSDEPIREVLRCYALDANESAFLSPKYPTASELRKGPLVPIPCLHRVHSKSEALCGAHQIQNTIGMSLTVSEAEERLRQLSQLVGLVGSYHDSSSKSPFRKALVTIDDGFKDVMLLQPIFHELSHSLQPVLCIPSATLRGCDNGMTQRHLPLTCLYAHCHMNNIDPNDKSKLGPVTRTILKTLPEKDQYTRLNQAGVRIDWPTDDLLSTEDLKALSNKGWWVCSHGPDHSDLTSAVSLQGVVRGLDKDMTIIEQEKWAPWFAWPEGRWCSRTADAIARRKNSPTVQFGLSRCYEGESPHPAVLNREAWLGVAHRHRVLVTGSSGFLGKHLLLVLQGYGYDVFTYDISEGKDILDRDCFLQELRDNKISSCVHLAAVADLNEADSNPEQARRVNIDGTRSVLTCCNEVGVRLLFASTCCVYGNNGEIGPSSEMSHVSPTELYAETKLESENEILSSDSCAQLGHVAMRLATFYGPSMRAALATSLFLRAAEKKAPIFIHGNGEQTRCFTHVHDIAEGIRVILQTSTFSGVVNVADNRECSVNALADIAMQVTGNSVDICHVEDRSGQIERSKIDNRRLRGLGNLGWEPTVTLEAGMLGCTARKTAPLNAKSDIVNQPHQDESVHDISKIIVAQCDLIHTTLPTQQLEKCDGVVYVTELLPDGTELTAYVVGNVQNSSEVHVRIHSECFTGDVLGSLKCDCGPQKDAFLNYIAKQKLGVFLYIKGHEGRGAGLATKIRAYNDVDRNSRKHHNKALLDAGALKIDARCYDASAELILRVVSGCGSDCNNNTRTASCDKRSVKLILHTNNKEKMKAIRRAITTPSTHGIRRRFSCEQLVIPAGKHCNPLNEKYLYEKEVDNGQQGLAVCAHRHQPGDIPDNIDELPGVDTRINQKTFDKSDPDMFNFLTENGYVVMRGLVSNAQVEEAKRSYKTVQDNLFSDVSERVGVQNLSSEDCSSSISQVRDLFLRGKECSVFRELTCEHSPTSISSMAQHAMEALDPGGEWTGVKLLHDHIINKPPGLRVSKKIPLHQDRMFWPVDIPACSTWIPLADVPVDGGCMELLTLASKPHLHHQNCPAVDFMADEARSGLKLVLEDDPHPVRWLVPMKAGETLIFSSHAWHRSSPNNQTDVNRLAYIQTWVHPSSRWRPDLVPWHPVNEHLRKEGCQANNLLTGQRHPSVGMHADSLSTLPDCRERVSSSCYERTQCVVNAATKKHGSHISMFDAGDVISTQIRNIFSLRISPLIFSDRQHKTRKALSLEDMTKNSFLCEQLVDHSLQMLKRHSSADYHSTLSHLYEESRCSDIRSLLLWTLKKNMISAAAYECDRSRNVFNSAYSAWWTVAGELWNEVLLNSKFSSSYELNKTDVTTFLKRIGVTKSDNMLEMLMSIIDGCMKHIPFQNFTLLTRTGPSTGDCTHHSPPTLGDIITDMLSGIGGLCVVRNPFLYLLLRALQFEDVRFVSGTMCLGHGSDELVDAHVALVVSVGGRDYWVDIANGWPYMKPIPVDRIDESSIISHPFMDTRLVETTKKGKPVVCVQHRQHPKPEWKDNYYFERTSVDYSTFAASMQKHYNPQANFGPFLSHLRFNMWSDKEGILVRDNDAWIQSALTDSSVHTRIKDSWDALDFAKLIRSSPFNAESELITLVSDAEKKYLCNVKTACAAGNSVEAAESVTVTGGFFDQTADAYVGKITVWRSQTGGNVAKLTFEIVKEYTPELLPVINKGFAGGSWYDNELYVCWSNRIAVIAPSAGWGVRKHIDSTCFNDLHHVHACSHGMWVANTGCDTVDEVNYDGQVVKRHALSSNALLDAEEDLRDQQSHDKRRNYRKEHVNYVSPLQCKSTSPLHEMAATALQQKKILRVDTTEGDPRHQVACLPSKSPPHEGFIATVPCVHAQPLLWNSTVDGFVIASDPLSGRPHRSWTISDYTHLPRGWTRGLLLLDDGFLVGSTVIRGDAKSWLASHDGTWNFDTTKSETSVSFIPYNEVGEKSTRHPSQAKAVSFLTNRGGKVFSLLRTPSDVDTC